MHDYFCIFGWSFSYGSNNIWFSSNYQSQLGGIILTDNVNHPQHYTDGGIECIDAMLSTFGEETVKSFCVCNAFKYIWRHQHKNGNEDIKKAQWYINKYLELGE